MHLCAPGIDCAPDFCAAGGWDGSLCVFVCVCVCVCVWGLCSDHILHSVSRAQVKYYCFKLFTGLARTDYIAQSASLFTGLASTVCGADCSVVVKLLDLDPQGRWFDPRCGHDKICTAVGP